MNKTVEDVLDSIFPSDMMCGALTDGSKSICFDYLLVNIFGETLYVFFQGLEVQPTYDKFYIQNFLQQLGDFRLNSVL